MIIYCVGAETTTLISTFDGLDPYFFPPERRRDAVYGKNERMNREVFVSRQSRRFSIKDDMIKVSSPICTLKRRVNIYGAHHEKDTIKKNKSIIIII